MMRKHETLSGLLLDEECELTLGEISRACSVHAEWIIELVDEGILEPSGRDTIHWRFSGPSIQRARATLRLEHDLGVNLAGAALVLELMDEIENLRSRINILQRNC
jgi:chaperone modulatory protein CbpM